MAGRADVVRIEAGASRGTGFLIDGGRVITALHVIGRAVDGALVLHGGIKLMAAVADGRGFRTPVCMCTAGDVVAFDAELDWACIAVDDGFDGVVPLAVRALADDDQGATWHSYGFPDSAPADGKATAGNIVSIAAMLRIGSTRARMVQVFAQEAGAGGVVRGLSGAPVIVDGHAIALLCTGQEDGQARSAEGTMYAVPLDTVRERLPAPAGQAIAAVPAVADVELCLVEVAAGPVQLTGCLITDEPALLDDEIAAWRRKLAGDPLLAPSVKQRMRAASLAAMFAEPVVRPRLLDLASVGSFALYAYHAAGAVDRAAQLLRLPLAHRLRKKSTRIARIHTRVDIAAALATAIAQVEAEERRTLARPALVASSPRIDLAEGLFAIIARRIAEPSSEDAQTDFAFLAAKTRLAFDVVTREARTRDDNPL